MLYSFHKHRVEKPGEQPSFVLHILLKYFVVVLDIFRTDQGNFSFTSDQQHIPDAVAKTVRLYIRVVINKDMTYSYVSLNMYIGFS